MLQMLVFLTQNVNGEVKMSVSNEIEMHLDRMLYPYDLQSCFFTLHLFLSPLISPFDVVL